MRAGRSLASPREIPRPLGRAGTRSHSPRLTAWTVSDWKDPSEIPFRTGAQASRQAATGGESGPCQPRRTCWRPASSPSMQSAHGGSIVGGEGRCRALTGVWACLKTYSTSSRATPAPSDHCVPAAAWGWDGYETFRNSACAYWSGRSAAPQETCASPTSPSGPGCPW